MWHFLLIADNYQYYGENFDIPLLISSSPHLHHLSSISQSDFMISDHFDHYPFIPLLINENPSLFPLKNNYYNNYYLNNKNNNNNNNNNNENENNIDKMKRIYSIENLIESKQKQPIVSIVIPFCNGEKIFEKTIESLISQTFSDFEIIIVIDCPSAISQSFLQKWQKKEKRIRKILQSPNLEKFQVELAKGSPSLARNFGVLNSSGKFILFIDQDDWIDHTMIEKLVLKAKYSNELDQENCFWYSGVVHHFIDTNIDLVAVDEFNRDRFKAENILTVFIFILF